VDDRIKEKARELTRGIKSKAEQIARLRDFTDRSTRMAGPGLSALPLSAITPAGKTLQDGYGNPTDRAILLYALCDAAKLNPRFVLSSNLPRLEHLAQPALTTLQHKTFEHLLVAITDKKTTYYLGKEGQYAQPGSLKQTGHPALQLDSGELITPKTLYTNGVETTFIMDVSESGHLDLIQKTQYTGTEFETFHKRFAEFTPELRQRTFQSMLSQISQSAVAAGDLRTSFSYPGHTEFAARIASYGVREGEHLYFTLPGGLGDILELKTTERETPYYLAEPLHQAVTYEMTLPRGWDISMMPMSFRTELPSGAGRVEFKCEMKHDLFIIQQTADLYPALITPEDYEQLVELHNQLTQPSSKTVLLRKQDVSGDSN
jgi:hypothetical protein